MWGRGRLNGIARETIVTKAERDWSTGWGTHGSNIKRAVMGKGRYWGNRDNKVY